MINKRGYLRAGFIFAAVLLLCFLFQTPVLSAAVTKDEILKAVQKRYMAVTDLTANYIRITSSPATESVFRAASEQKASGKLLFKKPNKLRLNQIKPRPETLVTNGFTVWWYIPADKQVQRFKGLDFFTDLKPFVDFLDGLGRLSDRFSISLTPEEKIPKNIYELVLVPADNNTGPQSITLWLDARDYSLIGFRFTSLLKETTDFQLQNIRYNQGLKNDLFEFKIPPDTEVIDTKPP